MAAAAEVTEVDLTNAHLPSLEGVELPPTLTLLDVTANRLTAIDPRILGLAHLQTLNFRQNLLTDASAFSGAACAGAAEDIEFRDNQLKEMPPLAGFTRLRRLEFSYNEARAPAACCCCTPPPRRAAAASARGGG